jgi:hypothetical protein
LLVSVRRVKSDQPYFATLHLPDWNCQR